MAILDKTRRHVSLSRNAARLLLAFAVALVCLVGTAQLRSQGTLAATQAEQEIENKNKEVADSDMARQLAISSAPTYYLIGPDGRLAAYSNEWTKIKNELASLLGEAKK